MRGEKDRDCRARGGPVNRPITNIKSFNDRGGEPVKAFHGKRSKNTPDATLKRGSGPIFRARGGSVAPEEMERRAYGGRMGHMDGGVAGHADGGAVAGHADGGAVARKRGGKVEGEAKKPHMGRAGRASGGSVGSDKRPLTSAATPKKPKGRHIMPRTEATP
jgi:hypothetical protein